MASSSSPTPAKKRKSTADVRIFNPTTMGASAHGKSMSPSSLKSPLGQASLCVGVQLEEAVLPWELDAMILTGPFQLEVFYDSHAASSDKKSPRAASGQGVTPSWPAAASQLLQHRGHQAGALEG